jgi:hypothetical protein
MQITDYISLPVEFEMPMEITKEDKNEEENMYIDVKEDVATPETPDIVVSENDTMEVVEDPTNKSTQEPALKDDAGPANEEIEAVKEPRSSKRVALLDASLQSAVTNAGPSWIVESASLVEKLEYWYPDSLEPIEDDETFIAGVWRNMGSMKGKRRKRKRETRDLFSLPVVESVCETRAVCGLDGSGGVLGLQRDMLVRLFSCGNGVIVIWGLDKRQDIVKEAVRLVVRLEDCDAGLKLIKSLDVLLGVMEMLAHFLPRRADAVSGLDIEAKIDGVDGWQLSRVFLKYWIEIKRRLVGIEDVRVLTRVSWIEGKLEKREMKVEEAVAAYENCAKLRAEFEDWEDHGNPFTKEITAEGLKAEIRKLESRRYVILDPARGDLLDHQARMIRILCPGKVGDVCDDEETRVIIDAREFAYSECGVVRRWLLRASVRVTIEGADAVVLAVAEFLDVLWNMDDSRVGDAIFVKACLWGLIM